jgi:hypothetical protein
MGTVRLLAFAVVVGVPGTLAAAEKLSLPLTISVEAGKHPRRDTPVSIPLPASPDPAQAVRLVETTGGKPVAVASQMEPGTPPRLWWLLGGTTPAGGTRSFRLEAGKEEKGAEMVVDAQPRFLEVRQGKAPVLRYNTAHVDPPRGVDARFGRSAFLHPVWTPAGVVVTDAFPPDHLHQDGIFLAYTKTAFEGRQPNFWEIGGGTGRVRFKEVKGTTAGPVFGGFRVEQEHVDLTAPKEKVALAETWEVRVWNVGGSKAGYWVWDLTSTLRCATDSPVRLLKYHYGGLAVRGARGWGKEHGRFETSEGKDRKDGNHTRPRWCDLAGPDGPAWAGLVLMTHPDNFRYPEPLRIHPDMPYMVYAPAHLGDWEIKPGKDHVARYRLLVHDDRLRAEDAERVWRDFAEPPTARGRPE